MTFYDLGLSGGKNSSSLRKKLQKQLGLPSLMSAASLMEVLNTMMDSTNLSKLVADIKGESDAI